MNVVHRIRFLYRAWNYRFRVEPSEIAFLLACVQRGQAVVDVGAHKGAFTYWLHKAVGTSGSVHSFEPQPELSTYLSHAKHIVGLDNVTVVPAGVSHRSGAMELSRRSDQPSPGATLVPNHESHAATMQVLVHSLDDYFRDHPSRPISFIKCDVEGHEYEVFQGAQQLLVKDRPVLMFECEQRHLRDRQTHQVFTYLQDIGYEGKCFFRGQTHPLERSQKDQHQDPLADDYINNFCFTPVRRAA
jgi:FkbM family methyltransferase